MARARLAADDRGCRRLGRWSAAVRGRGREGAIDGLPEPSVRFVEPSLLGREAAGRRQLALPRQRLLEIDAEAREGVGPRGERIGLGAVEHVAQRAGDARQVLLDADDLQRVEAIALRHRRLFVAQRADLPRGVEAEPDDHQHRDGEADGQARQGRPGDSLDSSAGSDGGGTTGSDTGDDACAAADHDAYFVRASNPTGVTKKH